MTTEELETISRIIERLSETMGLSVDDIISKLVGEVLTREQAERVRDMLAVKS